MTTATALLETVIINPKTPVKSSVIWLHGLGADGHDFASIVPQLQLPESLGTRFVFPHAPLRSVPLNQGYTMRAWFDITSLEAHSPLDMEGIKQTEKAIDQLIQQEISTGVPADHIALAGFSQGGAMVLYAGLRYPQRLAGIIGLSTFLPAAHQLPQEKNTTNDRTPILLAHGTNDDVIPLSWGQLTYQNLKKHHYNVAWHTYPMRHEVCTQEIKDIAHFLQHILF